MQVGIQDIADVAPEVQLPERSLDDPGLYFNFQLSWLAFNERVLEEAEDPRQPLLERAKFLAIVATNSDEFFMIRVAGLREARESQAGPLGDDGLTPTEVLAEINRRSQALAERQEACFRTGLVPALARAQIHILDYADLDDGQRAELTERFKRDFAPALTPLAVDTSHPFPFISNQSLSLLVIIGDAGNDRVARLKIPSTLPRLVPVEPSAAQPGDGRHRAVCFTWLEEVVAA